MLADRVATVADDADGDKYDLLSAIDNEIVGADACCDSGIPSEIEIVALKIVALLNDATIVVSEYMNGTKKNAAPAATTTPIPATRIDRSGAMVVISELFALAILL